MWCVVLSSLGALSMYDFLYVTKRTHHYASDNSIQQSSLDRFLDLSLCWCVVLCSLGTFYAFVFDLVLPCYFVRYCL